MDGPLAHQSIDLLFVDRRYKRVISSNFITRKKVLTVHHPMKFNNKSFQQKTTGNKCSPKSQINVIQKKGNASIFFNYISPTFRIRINVE